MQGDIVTYDYFGGLYINMTNRCDCHCVFCIRDQEASALGGLWLQEEPAKEAVLAEILAQDLGQYTEIVFCGYRVEPGGVSPPHPSRRRGEGLAGHAGFCPPGGPVRAQGDGLHRGL